MKIIKKMISFLIIFCVISTLLVQTAFASEVKTNNAKVTISIEDKTKGIFIDEIYVTLLNAETSEEYVFVVTSADYLFGKTVSKNLKKGHYNIAISYVSKDNFVVRNVDGSDILASFFVNGNYTFKWEVDYNKNKDQTNKTETTNTTNTENYQANTGEKEADILWNNFLDKASVIETDSKYAQILEITSGHGSDVLWSNYYEKITGRDKEEYINMSEFEQLLWYSTYITPMNAITSGDYKTYLSSLDKWNSRVIDGSYSLFSEYGTQEMADAYFELMEWQYNYFIKTGSIMNFMTGKSSLENKNLEVTTEEDIITKEEELEEIKEALLEEEEDLEKEIWGDTKGYAKNNIITIVILVILVVVATAITIYRKRKTIDDKEE